MLRDMKQRVVYIWMWSKEGFLDPGTSFPNKQQKWIHTPGDSKWPFDSLVRGHLTFPNAHLTIPKRAQRIARLIMFFFSFEWSSSNANIGMDQGLFQDVQYHSIYHWTWGYAICSFARENAHPGSSSMQPQLISTGLMRGVLNPKWCVLHLGEISQKKIGWQVSYLSK